MTSPSLVATPGGVVEGRPGVTLSAHTELEGRVVSHDRAHAHERGGFGYLPALDGLRALAVALVVAYHLGYSGVAGGYVGVEVFFVLSGWLVCALLVNEHRTTGRIDLRRFWLRRARRLLPAAVTALAGTLAVATIVSPDRVAALRSDALAALGYHLNWRLILDHQSYFEAADGPSALEHLWSLSIEEQFYLLFPLACGLLLALGGGRRGGVAPAVALVLTAVVASTVWRLALYRPQVDPSRLYFGTDTRAAGLLAGVALGLVWAPGRFRPRRIGLVSVGLDLLGLAGIGVLAWYATAVSEQRPTAFGVDFTLVQVATLLVIAAAAFPAPTLVGQALSARPLQWLGRRSYGIYLIHWPVIVFTARAPGQQPASTAVVAAEVAGTVALAAISYRWIEQPVRRRGFLGAAGDVYRRVERATRGHPQVATGLAAVLMVLAGGTVVVGRTIASASSPGEAQAEAVVISSGGGAAPLPAAPPAPAPAGGTGDASAAGVAAGQAAAASAGAAPMPMPMPSSPPAPAPPPVYAPTTAVGDSVMVGGAQALADRMGSALTLDAQVGRQMFEAPAIVRDLAGQGELGEVVVVHLGNNGPFSRAQIEDLFAAIGPDRVVVLVTVFVPRRWEADVNDALTAAVALHPNARLADWRSVAAGEPGLTTADGYHLNPTGAHRYADVVTAALSH